jgi:hypothetical protein
MEINKMSDPHGNQIGPKIDATAPQAQPQDSHKVECPSCEGLKYDIDDSDLVCPLCGGKGWIWRILAQKLNSLFLKRMLDIIGEDKYFPSSWTSDYWSGRQDLRAELIRKARSFNG